MWRTQAAMETHGDLVVTRHRRLRRGWLSGPVDGGARSAAESGATKGPPRHAAGPSFIRFFEGYFLKP